MTEHECSQIHRIKRIEADVIRFRNEIFGNGRDGMKQELAELRVSVRVLMRLAWVIVTCVLVNLIGLVFRIGAN